MRDLAEVHCPDGTCFRARVETERGMLIITPKEVKQRLRVRLTDVTGLHLETGEDGQEACCLRVKHEKRGGLYRIAFKHPEMAVPALRAECEGCSPEEAEAIGRRAAAAAQGKRYLGFSAVILVAALLGGLIPLAIGQAFDWWRFGVLAAIAVITAVVGLVRLLQSRCIRHRSSGEDGDNA